MPGHFENDVYPQVGDRVEIYWADDEQHYKARVAEVQVGSQLTHIIYDDGEQEVLDLAKEEWRPEPSRKRKRKRTKSPTTPREYVYQEEVVRAGKRRLRALSMARKSAKNAEKEPSLTEDDHTDESRRTLSPVGERHVEQWAKICADLCMRYVRNGMLDSAEIARLERQPHCNLLWLAPGHDLKDLHQNWTHPLNALEMHVEHSIVRCVRDKLLALHSLSPPMKS